MVDLATNFDASAKLHWSREFSDEEFTRIRKGFRPSSSDDKWYIPFESPFLYPYRSWTGILIFRVEFEQVPGGHRVVDARVNRDSTRYGGVDDAFDAALLNFLVSNLLLHQGVPFPRRKGMAPDTDGIYQHHVAGTGYPESSVEPEGGEN